MTDTNNAPEAQSVTVERNGFTVTMKPTKVTRGTSKGKLYYTIDWENTPLDTVLGYLGDDHMKILQPKINARFMGITDEARDEDSNLIDVSKVKDLAEKFSARGESMAELQEQLAEALDEAFALDDEDTSPENMKNIKAAFAKVKSLKNDINSKKRERTPKETATATAAN